MDNGNSSVSKWNGVGGGMFRQFNETVWRPLIQSPARSSVVVFFFFSLLVVAFLSTRFLDSSSIIASSAKQSLLTTESAGNITVSRNNTALSTDIPLNNSDSETKTTQPQNPPSESTGNITVPQNNTALSPAIPLNNSDSETNPTQPKIPPRPKPEFPLQCSDNTNTTQTCPRYYPETTEENPDTPPPPTCPDYFRWIHEDLKPWRETGITRDALENAQRTANFRLVILNGKAYVEKYERPYQTRDVFTLWGILQLLRKYPGRVPDLELMFDCVDWPVIPKRHPWPNATAPPLFRYCGDDKTLDIVFPDWSFWGWAEINIRPWDHLSPEIKEGNKKIEFVDREPYAYWKGNPFVAPTRMDLLKCNVSDQQDWGARIFIQDWIKESHEGFKQSNLASQCLHKYKIYIEGSAWSVSEKYILACDSLTLLVKPKYYDFFSRGLMPMQHYWPVKETDKCPSIKFAVEWGNHHTHKAEAIGKAASEYIHEEVKTEYVYDYMLHLLTEYAKLLKFKPTVTKNTVELCSEAMACRATDNHRKFMMESLVKTPSDRGPCALPPPYDKAGLVRQSRRKRNAEKQVEEWEKSYWINQTMPL